MADQLDAIFGAMKAGMDNVGNKAQGEFRGICSKCVQNIYGDDVVPSGQNVFHGSCFKCNVCSCDLKNKPFYFENNMLWCEADYTASNFPPCAVCTKLVMDEVVEFSGKSYHTLCFVCTTCKLPLAGTKFVTHEGNFYCVDDYHNLTAPVCKKCLRKIVTTQELQECLKVGDDRFHPSCFVCAVCERPFADMKAFRHQDKYYCDTHYTLAKAGKTSSLQS